MCACLARQMRGQRLPSARCFIFCNRLSCRGRFSRSFGADRLRSSGGFELFQLKFELLDLAADLLRAAAELHPPELGDQQLKMLDLSLVREQLGLLNKEHSLQRRGIESVQIRHRERRVDHAQVCHADRPMSRTKAL